MKYLLSLLLLTGSLLSNAVFAAAELVNPPPIVVPDDLSYEQIEKDIKRAMVGRGWLVEEESDGEITAVLRLRSHVARILIEYSSEKVNISYVSSENLKYREKKGKRTIHKNYLSWINNLASDINKNLQLTALDQE